MVCPPRSPITLAVVLLSMSGLAAPVDAEVVSSSDTHFVLRHQAASRLSAAALWERLLTPSDWWHPDHTYSGDAGNLTLEPTAGGLWREDWDGGSVAHGQVIAVMRGRMLRMEAPFGPLQGVGARVVWTITVEGRRGRLDRPVRGERVGAALRGPRSARRGGRRRQVASHRTPGHPTHELAPGAPAPSTPVRDAVRSWECRRFTEYRRQSRQRGAG